MFQMRDMPKSVLSSIGNCSLSLMMKIEKIHIRAARIITFLFFLDSWY